MEENNPRITKLPAGCQARAAGLDDLAAAAELINTCWRKRIGKSLVTQDELRNDLTRPSVIMRRDTQIIFDPHGRLVGYAAVFDTPPHVRAWVRVEVHPDYLGRGVGSALALWVEKRGQMMASMAPEGARVVLMQESLSSEKTTHRLLEALDYRLARHSLEMRIEMDTAPPAPEAAEGIILRACKLPEEERALVRTIRQSFKGHWGYVEQPFEDDLKEWGNFFYKAPHCDPGLLLVAQVEDRLVGTCFGVPISAEGPEYGWVYALGVLPEWRRKGLGLALLQHCFVEMYKRGMAIISLEVDAENLSGATRLYKKAGMHVKRRFDVFERELRPGEELS